MLPKLATKNYIGMFYRVDTTILTSQYVDVAYVASLKLYEIIQETMYSAISFVT
jgi:hypothetical protein